LTAGQTPPGAAQLSLERRTAQAHPVRERGL